MNTESEVREFHNGDKVVAGYQKMDMVVVGAIKTLKGWRYELAFPKKDGTINKRKNHRFFYADNLTDAKVTEQKCNTSVTNQ